MSRHLAGLSTTPSEWQSRTNWSKKAEILQMILEGIVQEVKDFRERRDLEKAGMPLPDRLKETGIMTYEEWANLPSEVSITANEIKKMFLGDKTIPEDIKRYRAQQLCVRYIMDKRKA